jgi:hypothetical protein
MKEAYIKSTNWVIVQVSGFPLNFGYLACPEPENGKLPVYILESIIATHCAEISLTFVKVEHVKKVTLKKVSGAIGENGRGRWRVDRAEGFTGKEKDYKALLKKIHTYFDNFLDSNPD